MLPKLPRKLAQPRILQDWLCFLFRLAVSEQPLGFIIGVSEPEPKTVALLWQRLAFPCYCLAHVCVIRIVAHSRHTDIFSYTPTE